MGVEQIYGIKSSISVVELHFQSLRNTYAEVVPDKPHHHSGRRRHRAAGWKQH